MLWRNREGKQVATITEWLASLGLPEYAQRFAENGIDVSVLRYLTDQDLEKIGVLLMARHGRRSRRALPAPQKASSGRRQAGLGGRGWRNGASFLRHAP